MPLFTPDVRRISASDATFVGTVRITGGPNITVGTDASGLSISGAAGGGGGAFTGGMSNIGNTSGTSGTVNSQMLIVGGNNVTVSQSINGQSATLSISAFNQSYQTLSFWDNAANQILASIGAGNTNGTVLLWPVYVPAFLSGTKAAILLSQSITSGSTGGLSLYLGVYTLSNSTKIASASSSSQSYSWTSSSGNAGDWGGYSGGRDWTVPLNVSMTPGNYIVGCLIKTTNAGTYSILGGSNSGQYAGDIGVATNASHQRVPFLGSYSAASASLPDTVGRSDVVGASGSASGREPRFILFTNI